MVGSINYSHSKTSLDSSKLPITMEETSTSNSLALGSHEDSSDMIGHQKNTLDGSIKAGDDSDGNDIVIASNGQVGLFNAEADPHIWLPPEPEVLQDDVDTVANYDDDDDYSDGTKWSQPSSLSGFKEHGSSFSFREERRNAMIEAMNGQFKILVSRFLASEGFSEGKAEETWLEIVTSLSWEAALLVKPDANEGRAMDPGTYVKVKCIATGARSESQVIKGLVFKKNKAHKHMPTKHKNPRLLLLQGILGQHEVGLSSFESMELEKDRVKCITEMIENCRPNVVLVEKTASRDIQELLLAKGITLVFDMKLRRLEKIARCTGSQFFSSADIPVHPKLRQCDSFRIEKIVEEHSSSGEGGKRLSKTVMFFEGFPKPLGCTILLKGANIDELKKVKRILYYTVFAAYHLILETSFFSDQRTFFYDMHPVREEIDTLTNEPQFSASCALPSSVSDECLSKSAYDGMHFNSEPEAKGLLALRQLSPENESIGLHNDASHASEVIQSDSLAQPIVPGMFPSSFSAPLRRIFGDNFPPLTFNTISSSFGFKTKELDGKNLEVFPASLSMDILNDEIDANGRTDEEEAHDNIDDGEKAKIVPFTESIEQCSADVSNKAQKPVKDDVGGILDPQSILVLLSRQCIAKQVVCGQSLSRIKYYGNFDVSLGRYLLDILLDKHSCSSCGEPPEAHVYNYTHQNGQLTVLIRQISSESRLSGEAEKRIWMWTRCLKCELESGIPKSTRRVLMSNAACGLSFGKFLDLSFSSHSAASRLSSTCGHSLHRDCLRFFGLGSKVAMFRYSSVEIYAACQPAPVLDFPSPNGQEWLKREARDVLERGEVFFLEVASMLQKLKARSSHFLLKQSMDHKGSIKDIYQVEEILMKEKADFEASLLKALNRNRQLGKTVNETLGLSWLNQVLLLELYIWDRRLHSLHVCFTDGIASQGAVHEEESEPEKDVASCDEWNERSIRVNSCRILESPCHINISDQESSSPNGSHHAQIHSIAEPKVESRSYKISDIAGMESVIQEKIAGPNTNEYRPSDLNQDPCVRPSDLLSSFPSDKECQREHVPMLDHVEGDSSVPKTGESFRPTGTAADLAMKTEEADNVSELSPMPIFEDQNEGIYVSWDSDNSKLENIEGWIWAPLSDLRRAYRKDLHVGYPQKFEFVRKYTPTYLSPMRQQIIEEGDSLHFPVGTVGNVMSVCEDEISSIIACALAQSEDQFGLVENIIEKEAREIKEEADRSNDNSYSLTSDGRVDAWSSTASVDSEGIPRSQSVLSLPSDELPSPGSEGSFLVDRLIASENLHPEIPVGIKKVSGKSKFSVICVHAREFCALRRMCCPSELAYISSLSRCKKWNAQGGKTKAFFAKSMDDRFIIKQIKKTELDSFLKFAPDYFTHISFSLRSGSQTCLAKILGIYQVKQNVSGKEVKTDLMVMENLLYGRNVTRTYDLKGAIFSRYVSDANEPGKVLLDQNFIEDMRISPIYVGGRTKHLLQRAIWNDTSFLTSVNVMDYSLLVGVDKQQRELVFGIIDYLRQYTWDKQLETWVKSSLVVPRNVLPTVISPREYKKRFRKFMSQYFLTVPDSWTSVQCSGPSKFCVDGSSDSSKLRSSESPE